MIYKHKYVTTFVTFSHQNGNYAMQSKVDTSNSMGYACSCR